MNAPVRDLLTLVTSDVHAKDAPATRETTTVSNRRDFITTGLAFGAAFATLGGFARTARAQASHILTEVQGRGTLRIATEAGNPPYSSFKPDGTPEGYDIDIGNELAAALKVKPDWIVVDNPGRVTALQTGKADLTIANFTNTVERSTVVAFTRPYVVVGSIYLVKKSSPAQTVADLDKPQFKVGVARGGLGEAIGKANTPNAELVRFASANDTFLALQSGQVDAQLLDSLQDAALLAKDGAHYRNLPGSYSYEEIAIGMPAGDADWYRIVDGFVRQLIGSGEDAKLFRKWFGFDMPPL